MAKGKFYLKTPKKGNSSIFFRLNYGAYEIIGNKKRYLPYKYYVNRTVSPGNWDTDTGRVKGNTPIVSELNTYLSGVESVILATINRMERERKTLTPETIKTALDEALRPDTIRRVEFKEFFAHYMNRSTNTVNTKKTYQQTQRDLLEFEKYIDKALTFDRIDLDFHNDFIDYLKNVRQFAPNTIGMRIKIVKTVMRAAHEKGLHNNTDYQKKSFTKPKEDTVAVYLNDVELANLQSLNLGLKLSNVRDWFLIGAYTGLRFSDLKRLSKENLKKGNIEITTQKTGTAVVIPLHPVVLSVLEKHNYILPKLISNQNFNEYIKEVCRLAGIDEGVSIEETKGLLKTRRIEPKYNLISAHTARRSFATNAYLNNVPTISIMRVTGHTTEKNFMRYIKVSQKENADKLREHPYFNMRIKKA